MRRKLSAVDTSIGGTRIWDAISSSESLNVSRHVAVAIPGSVSRYRGRAGSGVAVGHPPPQSFGRHVDQLGGADHRVGNGFALGDAGDRLDDIVERFQVLDVP